MIVVTDRHQSILRFPPKRSSPFVIPGEPILASGSATSDADQTTIATVAAPNQDSLFNADPRNVIEGKRFWRVQPINTADQDGKGEERFFKKIPTVSKLEDVLTNTDSKQLTKFESWKNRGVKPVQITERIKQFFPQNERYWGLGLDYALYLVGKQLLSKYKRLSPESWQKSKYTRLDGNQLAKTK